MRTPDRVLAVLALCGSMGCTQATVRGWVQLEMYDRAILLGRQQLEKSPDDSEVHYFMGVAYLGKDTGLHLDAAGYADSSALFVIGAFEHFDQAKGLDPGRWGSRSDSCVAFLYERHYDRGVIASKQNDVVAAEVEYRLATFANPNNYEGSYAHAAALAQLAMQARKNQDEGKFMELSGVAIMDLERVLELSPAKRAQLISAWSSMGELYDLRGEWRQAAACYEKLVEFDPENYVFMATLADRFYNAGDFGAAVAYWTRSLTLKEGSNLIQATDADTYTALAEASMKLGRVDAAIQAYGKARALKPDDPQILYGTMKAYAVSSTYAKQDGRMDAARKDCRRCIELCDQLLRVVPQDPTSETPEIFQLRDACVKFLGGSAGEP